MKEVKIRVNGKIHDVGHVMLGIEEFVQLASQGMTADMNYQVVYQRSGEEREHHLLPYEKLVAEDGMEFTVIKR